MTQRSHGAILLARTAQTQDAIAEKVSVSRVAVSQWRSGATKPAPKKRAVLLEQFGIPIAAWDDVPKKSQKKSVPAEPTPPPAPLAERIPGDVIGKARMLEEMALEQMRDLQDPELGVTPLEKAKVMASVAATLNLLAKLTGQFDLGARLFRLPIWKRIEKALEEGLRGHPKAAAAVARSLREAAQEQAM